MTRMTRSTTDGVQSSGGIGFFGALTILFIALKLTHVIAWSWLWVLAPLWIPFAVLLALLLLVFLFYFAFRS